MTGTKDVFHACLKKFEKADSIKRILVSNHNMIYIERYVDHRTSHCETLQGTRGPITEIRETIYTKLPFVAKGNFGNVDLIIEAVLRGIRTVSSLSRVPSHIDVNGIPLRVLG